MFQGQYISCSGKDKHKLFDGPLFSRAVHHIHPRHHHFGIFYSHAGGSALSSSSTEKKKTSASSNLLDAPPIFSLHPSLVFISCHCAGKSKRSDSSRKKKWHPAGECPRTCHPRPLKNLAAENLHMKTKIVSRLLWCLMLFHRL